MKKPRFQWFWTIAALWLLALTAGFGQLSRAGDHATGLADVLYPTGDRVSSDDHTIPNLPLPLKIGTRFATEARELPEVARSVSSWA